MSEPIYKYLDTDLDLHQVNSDYTLLLQVNPSHFSYALVYEGTLMAWAVDCDLAVLDEPGEAHELLNYGYSNVVVGLHSTCFTLVPAELFSENKIAELARFLDVKHNEKVFAQELDNANYIIYKVDAKVADTAEIFGPDKAVFFNEGWMSAIIGSDPGDQNLYLNIDKTKVDIFYFSHHKVLFYNSFNFNNPDELAYFTAYVAKELALQPKYLNLVISGDFKPGDANGSRLAAFFSHVEENRLHVVSTPPEVAASEILSLAALSLCVSSAAN